MILSNMDAGSLEGGVFGIFDKLGESLSRLDLAGSGPEGESFEANLANAANKYAEETPEFKVRFLFQFICLNTCLVS